MKINPFDLEFAPLEPEFKEELSRFESPLQFAKQLFRERRDQEREIKKIEAQARNITRKPELPKVTREEFRKMCKRFDSTYRYSDDRSSYSNGARQEAEISAILKAFPAWRKDYLELVLGQKDLIKAAVNE